MFPRCLLALERSLEDFSKAQLDRQTNTKSPGEIDRDILLAMACRCNGLLPLLQISTSAIL